ncbi:MAG: hypothetical protein KGQ41_00515 [Alphaproteobacteria bacterium]|nr:hypothetical protein [Alphaproteobacteria bacterium]
MQDEKMQDCASTQFETAAKPQTFRPSVRYAVGFSKLSSYFGKVSGASLVIIGTTGIPTSILYTAITGDFLTGIYFGYESLKSAFVGALLFTASHATISAIGTYREVVENTSFGKTYSGSEVLMAYHRRFNGQFTQFNPFRLN